MPVPLYSPFGGALSLGAAVAGAANSYQLQQEEKKRQAASDQQNALQSAATLAQTQAGTAQTVQQTTDLKNANQPDPNIPKILTPHVMNQLRSPDVNTRVNAATTAMAAAAAYGPKTQAAVQSIISTSGTYDTRATSSGLNTARTGLTQAQTINAQTLNKRYYAGLDNKLKIALTNAQSRHDVAAMNNASHAYVAGINAANRIQVAGMNNEVRQNIANQARLYGLQGIEYNAAVHMAIDEFNQNAGIYKQQLRALDTVDIGNGSPIPQYAMPQMQAPQQPIVQNYVMGGGGQPQMSPMQMPVYVQTKDGFIAVPYGSLYNNNQGGGGGGGNPGGNAHLTNRGGQGQPRHMSTQNVSINSTFLQAAQQGLSNNVPPSSIIQVLRKHGDPNPQATLSAAMRGGPRMNESSGGSLVPGPLGF